MTSKNTLRTSKALRYGLLALFVAILGGAVILLLGKREKPMSQSSTTMTSITTASSTPEMVSLTNEAVVRSGITVVPVESRAFTSELSTVGVIEIPEPAQKTIAARARGRIERMFVAATGTYVRKGDPLFEFYSPDILSAEKDYLIAAGAGEMDQGHTAGMEHHADAGLMRANKKRLELYGLSEEQIRQFGESPTVANTVTIAAPMDGLVLQKLAQEGSYVDEGTTIFQIADLSMVWAEVNVPEQNIRYVHVGQSIPIRSEAYPDENFVGKVIFISPVEDQSSRTIRVRLSLPNPSYKLRPQMTFTASIRSELGRSLAIPQNAVVRTGTGDYVWVLDSGNMFARHDVTLGLLSPDNYYQVRSGIRLDDRIASNGSFLVDAEHQFTKSNPMAGMNMGETGNKNSGEGTGTVRRINTADQTITLDHGNIPSVMSAMSMAYKVADPKFLQAVQVDESVRFTLTRSESGEWLITAIREK
ncbi:MAG: efflux RND transporter periplasmic adaptor subunit [Bacteroidota bacterium]|nr:efflux RND transporter periplasmic adaptor subunit [Bacteroidota bacterium]MDP4233243.1 efflux RND transporter periplasmic adaptor subunit [Bacteroidota bacterium]MDP4242137.1 efflux RND transporter periplasmic adaptor subunit [Bacteroidota bacterium]MDP4287786.1 efflux RND transporter periplasmic adaptor subunit [Bacteroidota bacterium]